MYLYLFFRPCEQTSLERAPIVPTKNIYGKNCFHFYCRSVQKHEEIPQVKMFNPNLYKRSYDMNFIHQKYELYAFITYIKSIKFVSYDIFFRVKHFFFLRDFFMSFLWLN